MMNEQSIPKEHPAGTGCLRAVVGIFLALVFLAGIVLIFALAFQFGTAQPNAQIGGSIIFFGGIGGGAAWMKWFRGTLYPRVMNQLRLI